MIRGTTPTFNFDLPFDTSGVKTVWVTFSQNNIEVFTCETSDIKMDGSTVSVKLTQEQTLLLKPNNIAAIQLRILMKNGDSVASNIMQMSVCKILKDGVIT